MTLPHAGGCCEVAPQHGRSAAPKPGSERARPQPPWDAVPGSDVSRRTGRCASRRNELQLQGRSLRLEHDFFQLDFCQKLSFLRRSLQLEPPILLLQLSQPPGLLGMHAAVLLPPAVIGRLHHLDDAADGGDGPALRNQLLCRFELADDLLGSMPGAFPGRVPLSIGQAEATHSAWIAFGGHDTALKAVARRLRPIVSAPLRPPG